MLNKRQLAANMPANRVSGAMPDVITRLGYDRFGNLCYLPTVGQNTGGTRLAITEANQRRIWDTEEIPAATASTTYQFFSQPQGETGIGGWAPNGKSDIDTSMKDSAIMGFNESLILARASVQIIHVSQDPTPIDMNHLMFHSWWEFYTDKKVLWRYTGLFFGSPGGYSIDIGGGATMRDIQIGNISHRNTAMLEPLVLPAGRTFKLKFKTSSRFSLSVKLRLRVVFDCYQTGSVI